MKKLSLVIGLFFTFNTLAYDVNELRKTVDESYKNTINQLSAQCASVDKTKIPETAAEMFCSESAFNSLAAKFCIYQNLINPNNKVTMTLQLPDDVMPNGNPVHTTMGFKCSEIEI